MMTLKRASTFEAKIKELETVNTSLVAEVAALKGLDLSKEVTELKSQLVKLTDESCKLVELSESQAKQIDALKAELEASKVAVVAFDEKVTSKAQDIVAQQGIETVVLVPEAKTAEEIKAEEMAGGKIVILPNGYKMISR